MSSYFLDSSALVKGYRREDGTARVHELLRGSDRLIISQLSHLEVSSAIVRRDKQATTQEAEIRKALNELDREVAQSLEVIEVNHEEIVKAVQLGRTHRVKAGDSLQLAAALTAHRSRPQYEFIFVSSDLELNAAAAAEGLQVVNPNDHA